MENEFLISCSNSTYELPYSFSMNESQVMKWMSCKWIAEWWMGTSNKAVHLLTASRYSSLACVGE